MLLEGHRVDGCWYRYGFGGHEKDDEVSGNGNHLAFGDYGYNPRIGRRFNIDPMIGSFPWMSPYATFNNNPIYFADPTGLSPEGAQLNGGGGDKPPKKRKKCKNFGKSKKIKFRPKITVTKTRSVVQSQVTNVNVNFNFRSRTHVITNRRQVRIAARQIRRAINNGDAVTNLQASVNTALGAGENTGSAGLNRDLPFFRRYTNTASTLTVGTLLTRRSNSVNRILNKNGVPQTNVTQNMNAPLNGTLTATITTRARTRVRRRISIIMVPKTRKKPRKNL